MLMLASERHAGMFGNGWPDTIESFYYTGFVVYEVPTGKELFSSESIKVAGMPPAGAMYGSPVTPVTLRGQSIETFAIEFNHIRDESALLELVWDKTVVPVRLTVDVAGKLVPQIEAAMAAPGNKSDGLYFQAATFYYNHDLDQKKALEWVNAGLAGNSRIAYEMLHLKAQILAKQGDKAGAIAAARQSTELAIKAEGPGSSFVKMNQDLISSQQP